MNNFLRLLVAVFIFLFIGLPFGVIFYFVNYKPPLWLDIIFIGIGFVLAHAFYKSKLLRINPKS